MAGRLAIDFGTSNTVVAQWSEAGGEGVPLHVPDYGRMESAVGEETISAVPSLIHYGEGGRRWLGAQVMEHGVLESPRTFRWMKRYIGARSPAKKRLDGREVSHFDAGRDFLAAVLLFGAAELGIGDEEVAFTVPVEAYEHYEDWLAEVATEANMPRFRLIDEPSAAALGYGAHIQPGNVYVVVDFGGGTLDVAVVLIETEDGGGAGRRCRVLGKAGMELGGATLDQWLFQEVLAENRRSDADDDVRRLSNALLVECERAKIRLSRFERAQVSVLDPDTGATLGAEFTRTRFEEVLRRHDLFAGLTGTLRRALNGARERGFAEEAVSAVLLVGGTSLVPSVQHAVQDYFGGERVLQHRPLDAVARGAAAFVAGVDFYDHIQHDYAIRWVNPETQDYDYRILVPRGTPYPTPEPVARLSVKATFDGQEQLGLAIFELGERRGGGAPLELVFDPAGAARLRQVSAEEQQRRTHFWMNEHTPTFLPADPPGRRGEARFRVEFSVDGNKRLLLTARDLTTGRITHQDYPVVKLS
jgi:molecular chaperone DnaK